MIKKLTSKVVYKNNWMTVREDVVQFSNGHEGIYGVVDKDDFTLIVPFDGNLIILVKQYRYPTQKYSWEFPQGKHEGDAKLDPEELAKEELKEETGITAEKIEKIGFIHVAPGYANQGLHIFLAQELKFGKASLDITEEGIVFKRFTIAQFEEMVNQGEITDTSTISAYGLLKIRKIV